MCPPPEETASLLVQERPAIVTPMPASRSLEGWAEEFADPLVRDAADLVRVPARRYANGPVDAVARAFESLRESWIAAGAAGRRGRVSPSRVGRGRQETDVDFVRWVILRRFECAEAAILVVGDAICHVDPTGTLGAWSAGFHRCPEPLPSIPIPDLDDIATARAGGRPYSPEEIEQLVLPVAAWAGLWRERNLLEDVLRIRSDRALVAAFARGIKQAHSTGVMAQLEESVARVVAPLAHATRWEWRHASAALPRIPGAARPGGNVDARALARGGFVVVTVPDAAACYEALGRVHAAFTFVDGGFVDRLGGAGDAPYQALHTRVQIPALRCTLSVHIVPEPAEAGRRAHSGPRHLAALRARLLQRDKRIRVYTPKGKIIELPDGATLLDFAALVHSKLVGYFEAAWVWRGDRQRTEDPFFRLADGDEVELITGGTLTPPPSDYRDIVADPDAVNRAWRKEWKIRLTERGRARVTAHLAEALDRTTGAPRDLDVLVGLAAQDFLRHADAAQRKRFPSDTSWWIREIGHLYLSTAEREAAPYHRSLTLTVPEARTLLACVVRRASALPPPIEELSLPAELLQLGTPAWCPRCGVGSGDTVVATIEAAIGPGGVPLPEGSTVLLHAAGEPCAVGGRPVEALTRSMFPTSYVVEAQDAAGVGSAILDVFGRRGTGIREIAGRSIGKSWGVVRVDVEPLTPEAARGIQEELRDLPAVVRVHGPETEVPELIASLLPARGRRSFLPIADSPYICGEVVSDPRQFRGRRTELRRLLRLARATVMAGTVGGAVATIVGPLRSGKSSLMHRLLQDCRESAEPAFLVASDVAGREPWEALEARLLATLVVQAGAFGVGITQQRIPPHPPHLSGFLDAWAKAFPNIGVVLAVDEAHQLGESGPHSAFERLATLAARQPGVLFLLVGEEEALLCDPPKPGYASALGSITRVTLLSETEVDALLNGHGLARSRRVRFSFEAVRHAHQCTRGDAFWLNHLAQMIWDDAAEGPRGGEVSRAEVDRALDRLVADAWTMRGRLEARPPNSPREQLVRRVAHTLLQAHPAPNSAPGRASTGWTVEEVTHALGDGAAAEAVRVALGVLEARGAVIPDELTPTWSLSCDAVRRYVRQRFDGERAG